MKKIILSLFVMLSILALGIKTKTLKADATVTLTEGASIRLDNPAGLRFQATVSESVEGAKYGIVFANGEVAKENVKVGIDGVVNAEVDELKNDNTYAVSMLEIPERAYFSSITARAYILIDNTYIYSDNIVTRNINEVARKWKQDNPDKQSDFITQVLSIAKLNTNGGTIRYQNHEAMVEDFLNDFNTYSGTTVSSATDLYDAGNVYGTFFTNTEMYTKWSWTLELFLSLVKQGYGDYQDAKSQYETFLSKNGINVSSQEYLRQSMQSLMTLSKCTSYNEEAAIDFSLYKVSSQIEGAINGGKEFVNINNLPTTAYRNGYTFKGWYDENNNLVTSLTEGIELFAKWSENYQLEIDAAYDLTESTLDLPTTVTIDGKKVSVIWDTTTFIEKQIGNQILTGTYTDEYNKECPINIKVNTLPYTFSQNTSTKEYSIIKYYGTDASVVVPSTYRGEKIISIGSSAFQYCRKLKSITLPSSLISIGFFAFNGCSSLENVYYDGTIGDWCIITFSDEFSNPMYYATHFYMKDSNNEYREVTEIVIPDTITSIGNYQFCGLSSLKSIIVPSSVTSIADDAFTGYSCENIYYDGTIEDWCNITFGDLNSMCYASFFYMKDSNNEYKEVTEIVIPDTITSIGDYQFCGFSKITNIILHNKITSIGDYAFSGCSFTYIELPSSITKIGHDAFDSCSSLISIKIPSNVTSIGSSTFSFCSSLKSIEIPSSITSIGDWAFFNCSSLTSINISDGVTSIRSSVFRACSKLTSIEIPSSVTSIGNNAFDNCSSLTSIVIPSSVTSIGNNAFDNCSSLTSIELPSSVTSIDDDAFDNCSSLTNVYYGGTIEYWCNITFSGYESNPMKYATHFYIKDSNNEYKEVIKIVIPDTITSIGDLQFCGFSSLKSISLPLSVAIIGYEVFSFCNSLENVYYDGTIEDWCNIMFSNYYSNPMCYATHFYMKDSNNEYKEVTEIVIPDTITSISDYRFYNFTALKSITLPSSVTSIGKCAFYECISLTNIEIPSTVTSIGYRAFYNCSSLTSMEIPSSVTSIGGYAFSRCSNLTIYCETEFKPSGWNSYWNFSNCPVVWGYKKNN